MRNEGSQLGSLGDLLCNLGKRQYGRCEVRFGYRTRHAPHHARRLVLNQNVSSHIADLLTALATILSHACEDNAQYVGSVDFSHRAEKDVNRWSA